MRRELAATLDELAHAPATGARATPERMRLWDLAVRLARQLRDDEDLEAGADRPPRSAPASSASRPRLSAADRRLLG